MRSAASDVIRWAHRSDAHAVGMLVLDALEDAPSSEVGLEDVYTDPREFGEQLLGGAAAVLVIERLGHGILGGARIVPREFIRASHVAEVAIVVHPQFRGRGVGRTLVQGVERELQEEGRYSKLVVRVAADDLGLATVLKQVPAAWTRERVERNALCRHGQTLDMHLYALLLDLP